MTAEEIAAGKRCFTFCGERCDCPAKDAFLTLEYVAPGFPVLESMCRTVGLKAGAEKAAEMNTAVRSILKGNSHAEQ